MNYISNNEILVNTFNNKNNIKKVELEKIGNF